MSRGKAETKYVEAVLSAGAACKAIHPDRAQAYSCTEKEGTFDSPGIPSAAGRTSISASAVLHRRKQCKGSRHNTQFHRTVSAMLCYLPDVMKRGENMVTCTICVGTSRSWGVVNSWAADTYTHTETPGWKDGN